MTSQRFSNKLSSKFDFKQSVKALLPANILLGLLMITNIINAVFSMIEGVGNDSIAEFFKYKDMVKAVFYDGYSFMGYGAFIMALCFIGALFAMISFLPFMNKKRANFSFSSPVTRADMFKNRILASVCSMAGILAIGVGIIAIINFIFSPADLYVIKVGLAYYSECLIYMLASFAIFSFAFVLSYTVIEALFLGFTLYFMPTALSLAFENFYSWLLKTFNRTESFDVVLGYWGESLFKNIPLLRATTLFNPILLGTNLKTHDIDSNIIAFSNFIGYPKTAIVHYGIHMYGQLIVWAAIITALIFLSKHIFVNRKVECTGLHASRKPINMFVATVFAFCTSAFVPVGSVPIYLVAVIVIYMISVRAKKLNKKEFTYIGSTTVALGLFVVILATGGLGYDSYVPKADKVEAVIVANDNLTADGSVSIDSNMSLVQLVHNEQTGLGIFTDKEDIEKVISVADKLTEKADNKSSSDYAIIYKMKNGKTIYRRYDEASAEAKRAMCSLVDTKAYEQTQYDFLTGNTKSEFPKLAKKYGIEDSAFFDNYFSYLSGYDTMAERIRCLENLNAHVIKIGSNVLEIENTDELRKAIAEDYKEATYDEIYFSKVKPVCFVGFYEDDQYVEEDEFAYENASSFAGYNIYPSMKNTIEYLNSINALDKIEEFDGFKNIKAVYTVDIKEVVLRNGDIAEGKLFCGGYATAYVDDDYSFSIGDVYAKGTKYVKKNDIKEILDKSIPLKQATADDKIVVVELKTKDNQTKYLPLIMINN